MPLGLTNKDKFPPLIISEAVQHTQDEKPKKEGKQDKELAIKIEDDKTSLQKIKDDLQDIKA